MASRRGFTLIELFVVISIIVVLASIALASLTILRRSKNIAVTMDTMVHIHEAVSRYIVKWGGKLGDSPAAFHDDPWKYLFKNQSMVHEAPWIELPMTRLVRRTGPGICVPATSPKDATHITDHWGSTPDNVLSWTVVHASKTVGFEYIQAIVFRSSVGTPAKDEDDIVYYYTAETSRFDKIKAVDLPDLSSKLTPTPSPPLMKEWKNPLE
jgi:prepilin-type N-terminal cleavage/methylation domain-containing protein